MASQLEQLLTCCICLDRYRNPKLLPCQHSVCMEPCMEGLVDYVRRQVKCPECRAEHRIPYNGVQGYPSNVTLQRFLEAHIEITGEAPDPHTGQIMERCGVCNEKNYLSSCAHCDRKICTDCKTAHAEVLKREIGRINNQVKRAIMRLRDQSSVLARHTSSLKNNTESITDEIENISKRLQKAVRDRCNFLKNEVETYYQSEHRHLVQLKEGLEQEISNAESNTELAEKHMQHDDQTEWDDCELMDAKDIFLRTMEFIRSFDYEPGDYNRRVRFNPPDDLNKLISSLTSLGDLVINQPKQQDSTNPFSSGGSTHSSGLMKSKSDHRLAAQFRDQDDHSYGGRGASPNTRRKFGERPVYSHEKEDDITDSGRRRFRSRFIRNHEDEEKSVRFASEEESAKPPRPRVIDTEDVSRGPLSGITRMMDSPRVIKRLQERDNPNKKKKEEPPKPTYSTTFGSKLTSTASSTPTTYTSTPKRQTSRQLSEDEIDKIKKQNKSDGALASASTTSSSTPNSNMASSKPALERLNSLKDARQDKTSTTPRTSIHSPPVQEEEISRPSRDYSSSRSDHGTTTLSSIGTSARKTSSDIGATSSSQRSYPYSRSSSTSSVGDSSSKTTSTKPKPLDTTNIERRLSRSNSTDSNKSDSSTSKKSTGAAFSTDELRNRFQKSDSRHGASSRSSSGATPSRYQSRFLGRAGTPSAETSKESENEDEEEEESSEETDSEETEETSSEEEEEEERSDYSRTGVTGRRPQTRDTTSLSTRSATAGNDSGYTSRYGSSGDSSSNGIGSRHSNSNDTTASSRRPSYIDSSKDTDFESKYPYASKYLNKSRGNASPAEEEKTGYQSRFLNRSKSSAIISPDTTSMHNDNDTVSSAPMGSSRARFEELKEKRQRLGRSKSSAGVDDEDDTTTASTSTSSYRPRSGKEENSSTATGTTEENSSSSNQLSNWARYLKNKYGNKAGSSSTASTNSNNIRDRSSATSNAGSRSIARSRSSHLLGLSKENENSEDESKNVPATPTSPAVDILGPTPFGNLHRSQYLQKQKILLKIGSRGSEQGNFTWPRGIAVGPDNSIVVADSSNHRVQVFDEEGNFVKHFGSYGNGEGEFDCLAGVAVNRIGQYIIADRYNHRIQIFDPTGTFLRCFGSQGSADGKFSYPWGVTTDSLGFLYVCDKENHRVQVFQSDGTFVGKFGAIGNKAGQLEHPHYIAVSSTNRVIVSDSNNHRMQIFDINGKVMSTFGSEGSEEGQFKFPRGVAVDEQGYIFVADSGNNRIQIFHPDGSFLRTFGCWGSGDGEFKGLEGVAVMSNGNILVCDRENHRIQMF